MFILNPDEFEDFNLEVAGEFIDFWCRYYKNEVKEVEGGKIWI